MNKAKFLLSVTIIFAMNALVFNAIAQAKKPFPQKFRRQRPGLLPRRPHHGKKFLSRRCINSSRRSRAVWSCPTAW